MFYDIILYYYVLYYILFHYTILYLLYCFVNKDFLKYLVGNKKVIDINKI